MKHSRTGLMCLVAAQETSPLQTTKPVFGTDPTKPFITVPDSETTHCMRTAFFLFSENNALLIGNYREAESKFAVNTLV